MFTIGQRLGCRTGSEGGPTRGPTGRADCSDSGASRTTTPESILSQKKLPPSAEDRRTLVEANHPELSVRRQCELLGLNRSTFYYEPAGETPEDLRLMRLVDELYT